MRDEQVQRRHVMQLFVLIALLILFGGFHRHTTIQDAQERIAALEHGLQLEREFGTAVFAENQELRAANLALRYRIIDMDGNLSRMELAQQACVDRTGYVSDMLPNASALPHRVRLSNITFSPSTVVLNVRDLTPGIVAPSGSMFPVLHEDTIVLEMTPQSPSEIYVGDIIIFEVGGARIIHRVVRIGWDVQGWFAVTRGDANSEEDTGKVRFSAVRGVVVGVIY